MRMRLISRLTLILMTLLFVAVGNAFGQFDSNIVYRITTIRGDQCLAVAGGIHSQKNGDPVIQWDCLAAETNQKWQIVPARNGYYQIIAQHSLKSLDVFGGIFSTGDGVRVDQWDYSGTDNQMWRFARAGDGICQIIARHSEKPLDMNGGSQAGRGSYAQQWLNWYGPNQKFKLQPEAWKNPPPSTPCQTEAESHIALYASNGSAGRGQEFRVNETIFLTFENNTGGPIYFNQEYRGQRLIREEGLQVERLNTDYWFPVLPSAECPPDLRETAVGTSVAQLPQTRVFELRATMNNTRSWIAPISLGPGTYRLTLAYSRSRDIRMPSVVCSSPFAVGVPR